MLEKLKAKMKMPKITLPKLKVPEVVKKAPSKGKKSIDSKLDELFD